MHRILKCVRTAFDLEIDEVDENTKQADIDKWDSIGTIRLVLCLEEEFGVSIPPEAARQMTDVQELAAQLRLLGVSEVHSLA